MFVQDGRSDEDTPEDDEEEKQDDESLETFMAAWRAKKKTNKVRLQRGVTTPKSAKPTSSASGSSKSGRSEPASGGRLTTGKPPAGARSANRLGIEMEIRSAHV